MKKEGQNKPYKLVSSHLTRWVDEPFRIKWEDFFDAFDDKDCEHLINRPYFDAPGKRLKELTVKTLRDK